MNADPDPRTTTLVLTSKFCHALRQVVLQVTKMTMKNYRSHATHKMFACNLLAYKLSATKM